MKIFIDFEATQENEIVSIGAVSESGSTFHYLVKPQFSSISQYLSQLIHLSNKDLENEKSLDEVFSLMYDWVAAQEPAPCKWEFLCYGTDNNFITASFKNIHSDKATVLAAVMLAKLEDAYKSTIRNFFHGPISLIHAFNYVENAINEQRHNPLEDALMFQKVYEYVNNNPPLPCHPLNKSFDQVVEEIKMPSGTFWCRSEGKNAKTRTFPNIDAAIDWYINTKIAANQRPLVHRETIMKNIMKSIRKKEKYANYYWFRNKEEVKNSGSNN